jgi:hypothetical protein
MAPAPPHLQLLFWAGCPSHPRALAELRELAAEAGLDADAIELVEILSEDAATRAHFIGSPTVRVDGVDVDPPPADASPALNCRVYRRPDGRYSPLPDTDDVRRALSAATQPDPEGPR